MPRIDKETKADIEATKEAIKAEAPRSYFTEKKNEVKSWKITVEFDSTNSSASELGQLFMGIIHRCSDLDNQTVSLEPANNAPVPAYTPKRRLKSCVEQWDACAEGEYNPYCCRFPKSCSCTVYSDDTPDELLED